jgi:hypothetical protein
MLSRHSRVSIEWPPLACNRTPSPGAGPHFDCKDHPMEAAPLVAVFDEWAPRTPNSQAFHDATLQRWVKENGVRSAKPLILSSEVPTLRKSRRVGQPLSWRRTKRSKTMCGPAPRCRPAAWHTWRMLEVLSSAPLPLAGSKRRLQPSKKRNNSWRTGDRRRVPQFLVIPEFVRSGNSRLGLPLDGYEKDVCSYWNYWQCG